jgi:hypothetical protein
VAVRAVRHRDLSTPEVDARDVAVEKADLVQQLAHGVHDVGDVEVARRDLMQHGSEEKEVVFVDDGDLDVRVVPETAIELDRGVDATEPAADDQDPLALRDWHVSQMPRGGSGCGTAAHPFRRPRHLSRDTNGRVPNALLNERRGHEVQQGNFDRRGGGEPGALRDPRSAGG